MNHNFEHRPVKTARGHAYLGTRKKIAGRLSESNLVGEDEQIEVLAAECLGLMPELREPLIELIRLARHHQEGLDKRRLLSDAKAGGNCDNPPGDTRIAAAVRQYANDLDKMRKRLDQQRHRFIDDLNSLRASHLARLDMIEGWDDPERVKERLAKRAEKAKMVTEPKPATTGA